MLQVVVLQCIICYTLILFLFQYRRGKLLITAQFLETAASTIFLETVADNSEEGKHHVKVRKSNASRQSLSAMTHRVRSQSPMASSKAVMDVSDVSHLEITPLNLLPSSRGPSLPIRSRSSPSCWIPFDKDMRTKSLCPSWVK
ncbi:auxin efflux carrier component 3-like [Pyrus ussuriensis x Pyrus communis]|uniref:Auxin efflux carrier component 3-like n=1 Tax=Pyrus ussuriensis x Pyrus communis TaxID=2448454 RepID=A0A5N5HJ59_9ROSA|nr:auxin efflux carrier component 3-like [Pyrus ussuriensis x Pyrus communis]